MVAEAEGDKGIDLPIHQILGGFDSRSTGAFDGFVLDERRLFFFRIIDAILGTASEVDADDAV